jgi:hypothetical protein
MRTGEQGGFMAEQIPEAWIGQEVVVHHSGGESGHVGVLESIDGRGLVIRTQVEEEEDYVAWYPITSVARIATPRPGQPRRQARASSF